MVIRFAPNKNNHKVVEEQAVWWGTDCYAKISHQLESFSNLHGSTVPKCYKVSWGQFVLNWRLALKRNTRSAPLAVRTSSRGSDQSQLIAICALTDLIKEALPSSFLIEAFWVSTFTSGTFIWCSSLWLSRIPCSGTCVTTTPRKTD